MKQETEKKSRKGVTRGLAYGQYVVTILLVGVAVFLAIQNVHTTKRLNNLEKEVYGSRSEDKIDEMLVVRKIRQFGTSFSFENFGAVTTYWNTHSCLSDGLTHYRGYVGAVSDSSIFTGGHKLECIKDPILSVSASGRDASGPVLRFAKLDLRGVTPNTNTDNWKQADGTKMPCTKCVVPSSDVVTGYGTTSCGHGFSKAYDGYAMTSWSGSHRSLSSDMICVREAFNSAGQTADSSIGAPRLTFIQESESTPNGRPERKIVRCVVCKKSGDKPVITGIPGRDGGDGAPGQSVDGAPGQSGGSP